ncbi:DUF3618 domain-containing protein [Silicimonas algicola]|uniref:Uncharacterized protein DUF3618 n=1 Tax=Silicimonas algicola TaxID=1826607 RepID=A0A316FYE3_9RHOB|nr:DUF3618 domain-containing protein [Silicimonas algicola]AZQ67571.1 DUF3618 domain-containing protein [Silicimonas algicola]PWK52726.1 uncharacterized protein DUF3618 [Silicimonas algicola]
MPHETRQPAEIERAIARERDELAGTLEELRDRLSFEGAWRRAGRHLRENGSDYGQTFGNMVREKPLALALTTIGLTWLIFGPATKSSAHAVPERRWQPRSVDADPDDTMTADAMSASDRAARRSPSSAYETATGASLDRRFDQTGDHTTSSYTAVPTRRPSDTPSDTVGTESDVSDGDDRRDAPGTPPSFQSERPDVSQPSPAVHTTSGRPEGTDGHDRDRNETNS